MATVDDRLVTAGWRLNSLLYKATHGVGVELDIVDWAIGEWIAAAATGEPPAPGAVSDEDGFRVDSPEAWLT